jgi:hypothetical protein
MKTRTLIKKLERLEKQNKNSSVLVEAIDENGEIYFTNK